MKPLLTILTLILNVATVLVIANDLIPLWAEPALALLVTILDCVVVSILMIPYTPEEEVQVVNVKKDQIHRDIAIISRRLELLDKKRLAALAKPDWIEVQRIASEMDELKDKAEMLRGLVD